MYANVVIKFNVESKYRDMILNFNPFIRLMNTYNLKYDKTYIIINNLLMTTDDREIVSLIIKVYIYNHLNNTYMFRQHVLNADVVKSLPIIYLNDNFISRFIDKYLNPFAKLLIIEDYMYDKYDMIGGIFNDENKHIVKELKREICEETGMTIDDKDEIINLNIKNEINNNFHERTYGYMLVKYLKKKEYTKLIVSGFQKNYKNEMFKIKYFKIINPNFILIRIMKIFYQFFKFNTSDKIYDNSILYNKRCQSLINGSDNMLFMEHLLNNTYNYFNKNNWLYSKKNIHKEKILIKRKIPHFLRGVIKILIFGFKIFSIYTFIIMISFIVKHIYKISKLFALVKAFKII